MNRVPAFFNETRDSSQPLHLPFTSHANELHDVLHAQDREARISSTNISSNFYLITQYILQAYFKVQYGELQGLKLVDLVVDATYGESLTLRKLNENTSVKSYEYFNTVGRQEDITRCPIFALATYFVIRWSHPNPPITLDNFDRVRLLDASAISMDRGFQELAGAGVTDQQGKVTRAESFEPPRELANVIFPWLPSLRQDMELVDRTNYKLHSFLELFEFMARAIVQDLKYLQLHPALLPNIVSFVAKFIPELFHSEKFLSMRTLGSSTGAVGGSQINGASDRHSEQYLELSRRLTTENVRLGQQITQLKTDLGNVRYMCDQILRLQRQVLRQSDSNASTSGIAGGGPSLLSNLVQSAEESTRKRKLPLPTTQVTSPFPLSPGGPIPRAESPHTKRLRSEERPTPSQTALDMLLSRTANSPRFPTLQANPSRGTPRYSSPTTFAIGGSPGAVLPPVPLQPRTTQPEAHSQPRRLEANMSAPNTPADNEAAHEDVLPSAPQPIAQERERPHSVPSPQQSPLPPPPSPPPPLQQSAVASQPAQQLQKEEQQQQQQQEEEESHKPLSPKSTAPADNATVASNKKNGEKLGPNRHIKYKLSRDNKTIWDLYTEWYIGLKGHASIKNLIENYGLRRWKVSDDSHFFPTRRIIMDYIEMECDRGIKLGRFTNPDQRREDIRKIIVGDLEKFRINNGLTLNSLSMYFKNLTKENKEICIFQNFRNWSVRAMTEEEKNKYCKRQHMKENI
ncbi:related to Glycolytic genes transcriptional activator GCR1 [Zygosaccharomyces bailii]|nr:related to Glycolytic genes transcriptional activator GCR1 [Zygosaccharomyces bailii ISA1307]SJM85109.1 related to Glycolytic genes transcriptional activator GCR1 [Zygosaccharomyces bailii]